MPHVGDHKAPPPRDAGDPDDALEAAVTAFLAVYPPAVREIARALRATLRAEAPDLVEYVSTGYRMIMSGRSTRTPDFLFGIAPYPGHVDLQLIDGAALATDFPIVKGRGRQSRHVKVGSVAAASSADLVAVIRAQVALRPPKAVAPAVPAADSPAAPAAAAPAADPPGGDLEADVDRLLSEHSAELQAIERALRATIRTEFPDAVEQVDFGNKLIAFGRSMRMRGLLFAIIAHQTWVNLQLADGADLPDPNGVIEGTGKRIRHVKVRSVEVASSGPVVTAIRAQLAARPDA